MKSLKSVLNKAIEYRQKLTLGSNAMRLVNSRGDDLDGLLIDQYNKHLQVQFLTQEWQNQKNELLRALLDLMPIEYLIIKSRQGLSLTSEILIGQSSKTIVEEKGIRFEVDLNDGLNCGLFLDMRQNRSMVAQACKSKKVFNGFAYTCSFGLHARIAGAREVINCDISRKILDRGRLNYELNNIPYAQAEFVKLDTVSYLQRAFKKGNNFDVVILDPPSFARHEGKTFQVKADLPKLMALGVAVLNSGGYLFVSTNYSELSHADLERILSKGLNGRRVHSIELIGQDKDFVGSNTFKESFLVGLWVKFL